MDEKYVCRRCSGFLIKRERISFYVLFSCTVMVIKDIFSLR